MKREVMMKEVMALLQGIKPEIDFRNQRDLITTGVLDSFDIVMLVSALDETYNILINGLDIIPENFIDLQSIYNLVEKYRRGI